MTLGEKSLILDSVDSTQSVAAGLLQSNDCPDIIIAREQLKGRGRLGRIWSSTSGESLTMTLLFKVHAGHQAPWLIGMSCAIAAATVLESRLQWPNDLVTGGKKLGGILTELMPDRDGNLVPVVGIGVNVRNRAFPPELQGIATSIWLSSGKDPDPLNLATDIVAAIRLLPEPRDWSVLQAQWAALDATPGKSYKSPTGERVTAKRVDDQGRLVADSNQGEITFMAAEALYRSPDQS